MKKIFLCLLISCLSFLSITRVEGKVVQKNDLLASLKSKEVILMNRDTKEILLAKNINKRIYPASMTKIMTAIIVIENTKHFDKEVEAIPSDTKVINDEASIAGLLIGERMSVKDALYCTLLASGSDAAEMLGHYTTGNTNDFVDLMNQKAKDLHMNDTHFTNVYGKYDKQHYSTVKDMALLMDYAMDNPVFKKIMEADEIKIKTNAFDERIAKNFVYATFDKVKINHSYITGAKSGSMDETGLNLASTAEKNGKRVVAVTAEAPLDEGHTNNVIDADKIYQWYFKNYKTKNIYDKNEMVEVSGNFFTPSFKAPINKKIYVESYHTSSIPYEKRFFSTTSKMIVLPNDVVGILTIKTKDATSTYEILSDRLHIAIGFYFILIFIFLLTIWLFIKKKKQIAKSNSLIKNREFR